MTKSILNFGTPISKIQQKRIHGGTSCYECYDNCVATSRDRMELGICFDNCSSVC